MRTLNSNITTDITRYYELYRKWEIYFQIKEIKAKVNSSTSWLLGLDFINLIFTSSHMSLYLRPFCVYH